MGLKYKPGVPDYLLVILPTSLRYNVRGIELRGKRPLPAVLDSSIVSEVETDLDMAVDNLGCNEEDEGNQPFVDEDDDVEEDDNVSDD